MKEMTTKRKKLLDKKRKQLETGHTARKPKKGMEKNLKIQHETQPLGNKHTLHTRKERY